jgi:hypothetical protein
MERMIAPTSARTSTTLAPRRPGQPSAWPAWSPAARQMISRPVASRRTSSRLPKRGANPTTLASTVLVRSPLRRVWSVSDLEDPRPTTGSPNIGIVIPATLRLADDDNFLVTFVTSGQYPKRWSQHCPGMPGPHWSARRGPMCASFGGAMRDPGGDLMKRTAGRGDRWSQHVCLVLICHPGPSSRRRGLHTIGHID